MAQCVYGTFEVIIIRILEPSIVDFGAERVPLLMTRVIDTLYLFSGSDASYILHTLTPTHK